MIDPTGTSRNADPRRRLQQLLAVPERERTDEQWDEIAALELELAPANRIERTRRDGVSSVSSAPRQPTPGRAPLPRHPGKKFKKSKR